MARIASLATSRPKAVLAAALLALLVGAALGSGAGNALNARNDFADPGSASAHARAEIERATGAGPGAGVLALVRTFPGAPSPTKVRTLLASDPSVARVAPPVPARDGSSVLVAATLRAGVEPHEAVDRITRALHLPGVQLGGYAIATREIGQQASSDLGLAEALAFPLLALLAFVIFRGVAALLPVAVGGLSVLLAFALLRAVNAALPLSVFALNLVIGLGLGLAVDYSLFLLSRFREELGRGAGRTEAIAVTMATAGRTVLYSAATVAIALSSLTVFPLRFLQSMGIGGALVALVAAAVALTALPAMFALFGDRLGKVLPEPAGEGRWYRFAHAVLRRPGLVAAATALVMLLAALPALRTHWSGVDASVLPSSRSAHAVETALARNYPQLRATPTFAAVTAPAGERSAVAAYAAELRAVPGVATVAAPDYLARGLWRVEALMRADPIAASSQQAISAMRALPAPFPVAIGGAGAEFADQRAAIAGGLPAAVAILVLGTLLVLWLMTGSVVLPVKALLMNALTVAAATGLLVLVFQDGRFQHLLGYSSQHGIEQSDYLVLAAIAFALSTDYGVFLITRIKEARDAGAGDREAVALGLQRTGRIVTAAALLLAVAIGAFATSQIVFLKEIGLGAVAAVLLDAFAVRALLVPALMGLLGRWNWWAPAPLRRLHERFGLREAAAQGSL